jgi:dimethylamine monooxygenase subunit A
MTYLPFEPGPHRLQMGLMALKPEEWIELDETLGATLLAKRRLLAERHDEVFAALPGTEAAGAEVLDLLADHLPRRFPTQYPRMNTTIAVAATGELIGIGAPGVHPLETASRLVPEDLCLMRRTDAGYVLAAGCVCFPSRWRLADKIGRNLAGIHAPVPGYSESLGRPVDRFFEKLTVDKPVWRLNWTIHARSEPFQPVAPEIGRLDPAEFGDAVFLRIERQTLRRLPRSGDVLFTIRTYIRPLGEIAQDAETAHRLAGAIENLPPAMRAYRSMTAFADDLVAWLRDQAR